MQLPEINFFDKDNEKFLHAIYASNSARNTPKLYEWSKLTLEELKLLRRSIKRQKRGIKINNGENRKKNNAEISRKSRLDKNEILLDLIIENKELWNLLLN